MSLNEDPTRNGQHRVGAGSVGNGVISVLPRSKSFTGISNHRRSGSSASAEGCLPEAEVGARSTWGPACAAGGIRALNSPKLFRRPLSFTGQKNTKNLNSARAVIMFEKVTKGIRECVVVTEEDIVNLKQSMDELSTHSQQQLKAAERYMKRLEYQLSKLEELCDQYNVQLKLREGMRTMATAYISSTGKERESALNSVKASYKESAETMYAIELQLEKMMGTFHFQMKGIQGFARLCSGDVFEITVKHSSQKWKSRGRVLKNGHQAWDCPHATFKALLGEILFIKAVEIKGLGKTVLLGNKYCETRDLFSASPQIMTINLNPSGSLKLNVVITWNPLDGHIDEVMRNHSASSNALSNKHLSNISTSNEKLKLFNGGGGNLHKFLSQDSLSHEMNSSRRSTGSNMNKLPLHQFKFSGAYSQSLEGLQEQCPLQRVSSSDSCSINSSNDARENNRVERTSVFEALQNLNSSLEDIQGQYPELQALELLVSELEEVIGKRSRWGSQSSQFSTSIESVLECFDFLNTETDDEDMEWIQNKMVDSDKRDPGSTAKTSDSGIGSLSHASPKRNSSPTNKCNSPTSLDENQVDLALVIHLSYCQSLIESLGSFGPLKCKEVYALEKLRKQIPTLERLLHLFRESKEEQKDAAGMDELKGDVDLQRIWARCAESQHQLCIPANTMVVKLEEICQQHLTSYTTDIVSLVAKLMISRMVDTNRFDPSSIVTVYQMRNYFQKNKPIEMEHLFQNMAEEVRLTSMLQSPNVPVIMEAIDLLSQSPPLSSSLQMLSQLFMVPQENVQGAVTRYFVNVLNLPFYKKIVTTFIEALESESSLVRQGACFALLHLKAVDHITELMYVCQTDECISVRDAAKQALLSFGSEGIRAYEQSQLSNLGFQGMGIK